MSKSLRFFSCFHVLNAATNLSYQCKTQSHTGHSSSLSTSAFEECVQPHARIRARRDVYVHTLICHMWSHVNPRVAPSSTYNMGLASFSRTGHSRITVTLVVCHSPIPVSRNRCGASTNTCPSLPTMVLFISSLRVYMKNIYKNTTI